MNRKNKLKWGLVMLGFLLFWVVSLWIAVEENTWKAWALFAFWTLGLLVGFINFARVVIGAQSVLFTDENLVIVGVFGRKTPIPWNRIKGFGTWQTQYQNQIKVYTRDTEKDIKEKPTAFRRFLARVNYNFSGAIYFILEDMSGISMEELLEKCNKELKKHQKVKQIKRK